MKRLHHKINEGREQKDYITATYIYKKIYSERKKDEINLLTRNVDLIANYVGPADLFSSFF
ncbi:MAG TPA: hypothetical protein DCR93_29040 [Cytophagales bacterium]|nr:hypothetical protein [Cytophagales bacterium]HAP63377.1 hypothetical protein [Cytophagales bacterium]